MSQNRQAVRDRLAASLDYEINLKAEIEIMSLHDKLDRIRLEHLEQALSEQTQQIGDLNQAATEPCPAPSTRSHFRLTHDVCREHINSEGGVELRER